MYHLSLNRENGARSESGAAVYTLDWFRSGTGTKQWSLSIS